ncbi:MAG: DoxX family membrane protein [Candidatus Pacearchaeota archaeon]|jgi:uncharacterized membrane protein YphA (DoxX/SURF4 family)
MKKRFEFDLLIRIFIGLVFLSAAVYRIFNFGAAEQELSNLNMPIILAIPLIMLEICIGLSFLFNFFIKQTSVVIIIFLVSALLVGFFGNFESIIQNLGELFVFSANPTDMFLHFVYLLIVIFYVFYYKK